MTRKSQAENCQMTALQSNFPLLKKNLKLLNIQDVVKGEKKKTNYLRK